MMTEVYNALAIVLRRANAGKRFNRSKAAGPLHDEMVAYWSDGVDDLFTFLVLDDGWGKIQRHVQADLATQVFGTAPVAKALTDSDRRFFADLLANFGYWGDVENQVHRIMAAASEETFNAAGAHALQRIGVGDVVFDLKNEQIVAELAKRESAGVHATRNNVDQTFSTITNAFYELGQNPYNQTFIEELRKTLNVKSDWEAKRFALTETGIVSELAQARTYRQNGVQRKRWNASGINTRESHAAIAGSEIGIDDKFDLDGAAADHPLDPALPAGELVNCHCWLSPVVNDEFQIDPDRIWSGE